MIDIEVGELDDINNELADGNVDVTEIDRRYIVVLLLTHLFLTLSFSSREALKNPHKRKEMAFFAKINHPSRDQSKRINH